MSYSVQLVVDAIIDSTETGTESEYFHTKVSIAGGASDISIALGALTAPVFIAVLGEEGISFKLGATGTDSIGADPAALVQGANGGLGITEILVSNSDAEAHAVTIIAAE